MNNLLDSTERTREYLKRFKDKAETLLNLAGGSNWQFSDSAWKYDLVERITDHSLLGETDYQGRRVNFQVTLREHGEHGNPIFKGTIWVYTETTNASDATLLRKAEKYFQHR